MSIFSFMDELFLHNMFVCDCVCVCVCVCFFLFFAKTSTSCSLMFMPVSVTAVTAAHCCVYMLLAKSFICTPGSDHVMLIDMDNVLFWSLLY